MCAISHLVLLKHSQHMLKISCCILGVRLKFVTVRLKCADKQLNFLKILREAKESARKLLQYALSGFQFATVCVKCANNLLQHAQTARTICYPI